MFANVKFIEVQGLSRTSSSCAESDFAQSADFAHHIGCVVVGDDINLVACFVSLAQLQLWSEFATKQITRYGFDDSLHIVGGMISKTELHARCFPLCGKMGRECSEFLEK